MPRTRARTTRYQRRLGVAPLTVITLFCVTLTFVFVRFVVSHNRIASMASEQRRIEQQIGLYRQEIDQLKKRIDLRMTRGRVEQLLAESGTLLQMVNRDAIITIPATDIPPPRAVPVSTSAPTVPSP